MNMRAKYRIAWGALGLAVLLALCVAWRAEYDRWLFANGMTPDYISIGQSIVLEGMSVKFLDVVSDSRCPAVAQCVWAGKVSARVALASASTGSSDITLDSGVTMKVGSYQVTLEDMKPAKPASSAAPIAKSAYRARFKAIVAK